MSHPAPPPCEICEQYRMEDARWILESHINGLHQELAALTAERDKAVAKLDRLCEAVLYTTELYREPLRYTTSKAKLKPNLSTRV